VLEAAALVNVIAAELGSACGVRVRVGVGAWRLTFERVSVGMLMLM